MIKKYYTDYMNRNKYALGNRIFNPSMMQNNGDWRKIQEFLKGVTDIKKNICHGCPTSKLYDDNLKPYLITRALKLEEVEYIVEQIRIINKQKEQATK